MDKNEKPQIPIMPAQLYAEGLFVLCRNHRAKTGIIVQIHADDCEKLPCQIGCPVAKRLAEYSKWWKEENRERLNEKRAIADLVLGFEERKKGISGGHS